jgi:hypothetical protein
LINIVHNQLIVKPVEVVITRDQFKPFIALCTGERNTRVGSYYYLMLFIFSLFFLANWRSPSEINIEENSAGR